MSNDLNSINSLLHPTDDESSVTGRFNKKQKEIKNKRIEQETEEQAEKLGLEYLNLIGFPISPEALSLIQEKRSQELQALCFLYDGRHIRIACTNFSKEVIEEADLLSQQYFADVKIYLVSNNSLQSALKLYKTIPKIKAYKSGVEISEKSLEKFKNDISNYKSLNDKINDVNTSDIITLILATALKIGASDVHIETEENKVIIRLRLDGVLQKAAEIDKKKWNKIVTRLKILSRVKINIKNQPQDGRYTIYLKDQKIDIRCSFLPTAYGESVVMRILNSNTISLELESLGVRKEILPIIQKEISKPNGLILTTGPTGSGKTTTLYSILNKLNKPGTKIITLENPIEYQLEGINQSQINPKKNYSFSNGLRSILRQDPNIIMIGEIRDLETAEIAVQASLTGHLVLSTLHTNDASGVIPRLIDIGVKPYFLVPSINAVVGQRLIRKLCPHCKVEHKLNDPELELVNKILAVISPKSEVKIPAELPKIYKAGQGCEKCGGIAYKGRTGIYEVFTMDDKLKQLTIDKAPAFKILQQAIENGMITMLQDGVLKVLDGISSLEEVYRVIGKFDYINELYDIAISQTIKRGIKITKEQLEQAKVISNDIKKIDNLGSKTPSNELVPFILSLAVVSDAGDVHIEPEEEDVKVRFRIDGVLHDIITLSKTTYLPLLSEIKILAGTDTNIKKATFDGRFVIRLMGGDKENNEIDCRLSIINSGYGETIVIRILSSNANRLDMHKLGIAEPSYSALQKAMKKTRGIIITTGPTGSGKTTTLYSILNQLNKPDIKIITIEDPIEYHLPGIMQTQIDEISGYTFAAAMRSLLRQNPNIMMIGEIRDSETAKISIEASMTGHLVLSTIHANSAAGAISRFVGLGLDTQTLANAIEFTIGQRLVRKICPYCKEKIEISNSDMEKVKKILSEINNKNIKIPEKIEFYHGTGCSRCNNIGYKGRLGLYEGITMTPEIQRLIQQERITDHEIEQAAIANGMVTMLQDGVLKALKGETSLEEIFRVI